MVAPVDTPLTVYTEATRYEVSCLPLGHPSDRHFRINVEWRSPDKWAVLNATGEVLGADGTWSYEMQNSSRTDDWKATHRFTLAKALELANEAAPKMTLMGHDVQFALDHPDWH